MKKTTTNTMGLLAIASLALSLTACSSEETPPLQTPTEAACVDSWDEIRAGIKAPENADKVGGDEAAIAGMNKALDAAQAFYTDSTPAGVDADDVERTPEDFASLRTYLTEREASNVIEDIVPLAISNEDTHARSAILTVFPQTRFANALEWERGGEMTTVLDTTDPADVTYCFKNFRAEVEELNGEYDLVTRLETDVTQHGTLGGEDATFVTNRILKFNMVQAEDGSWAVATVRTPIIEVLD